MSTELEKENHMEDVLRYEGTRAVVTGAASGMGAATATILAALGAEVHGLDIQPCGGAVHESHLVDLSDTDQIDAAVEAIGGPIDSLFNCAGLPTTAPDLAVMLVNFAGHRHLTEAVIPLLSDGAGIAFISSVAGMGWVANAARNLELVMTPDFDAARTWCEEHPEVIGGMGYSASKEAINAYVAFRGFQLAPSGVRLNSLNPGPTDTPMMPSFIESQGQEFFDNFPKPVGRNARPDEQAWALVLLNSPRNSYTTATSHFADGGFTGGLFTGGIDMALLMPPE
jgi:NAD(P)-dependent dehydrogenase (short-subunit alcohol dehydrogenase family)